jgi:hypothetical protein
MYKFEYTVTIDLDKLKEQLAANNYKSHELKAYYLDIQKNRERGNLNQAAQIIKEHLEYKKCKLLTDSTTLLTPTKKSSTLIASNSIQNILNLQRQQDVQITSTHSFSDDEVEMQQQQASSRQMPTRVTFGSSNAQAATSTSNDDPQIAQFSKMFASMLSTEMSKQTNKLKQLETTDLTETRIDKMYTHLVSTYINDPAFSERDVYQLRFVLSMYEERQNISQDGLRDVQSQIALFYHVQLYGWAQASSM